MALPMSFWSLLLYTPLSVLVVLAIVARWSECCWACASQWYLFFSLLAFLSEVLLLPLGEKLNGFGAKDGEGFVTGLLWTFWMEEACNLARLEWAGWLPYWQHWSISCRINGSCRLVFDSTLIAFFISSSKQLYSYPRYSI